jgi:hypothetical protein
MKKTFLFLILLTIMILFFSNSVFAEVDNEFLGKYGGKLISYEENGNWNILGNDKMRSCILEKDSPTGWLCSSKVLKGTIQKPSYENLDITLNIDNDAENWVMFHHYLVGGIKNSWRVQIKRNPFNDDEEVIFIYKNMSAEACYTKTVNLNIIKNSRINVINECGIYLNADYEILNFRGDVDIRGFGIGIVEYNRILDEAKKRVSGRMKDQILEVNQNIVIASGKGLRVIDLALPNNFMKFSDDFSKKVYVSRDLFELNYGSRLANNIVVTENNIIKFVIMSVSGKFSNNFAVYIPKEETSIGAIKNYKDLEAECLKSSFIEISGEKVKDATSFMDIFAVTSEVTSYASMLIPTGIMASAASGVTKLGSKGAMRATVSGLNTSTKVASKVPVLKRVASKSALVSTASFATTDTIVVSRLLPTMTKATIKSKGSLFVAIRLSRLSAPAKAFVIGKISAASNLASARIAGTDALNFVARNAGATVLKTGTVRTIGVLSSGAGGIVGEYYLTKAIDDDSLQQVADLDLERFELAGEQKDSGSSPAISVATSAGIAGVSTGISVAFLGAGAATATVAGGVIALGVVAVGAGVAFPIWYYGDSTNMKYGIDGDNLLITYNNNWIGSDKTIEQIVFVSDTLDDFDFDMSLYEKGYAIFEISNVSDILRDCGACDNNLEKYFDVRYFDHNFYVDNKLIASNKDGNIFVKSMGEKWYLVINNLPISFGDAYNVNWKVLDKQIEFRITDPTESLKVGKCNNNMRIDLEDGACK